MRLNARFIDGPMAGHHYRLISWEQADQTPANPTADKREHLPKVIDHEHYGTDPMDGPPQVTERYELVSHHQHGDVLWGTYAYQGAQTPAGAD